MATQEEFKVFYEVHLKPKLIALDKQRQSLAFKLGFTVISYFVLMGLLILVMSDVLDVSFITVDSDLKVIIAIVTMIVITVGVIFIYGRMTSPFKLQFKQEIINSIVTFIDRNLTYDAEKKVPVGEFHASQLFKRQYGHAVDVWEGEDYVQGTVGNTTLKFSEVNAQEEEIYCDENGCSSYYVSIYKGLFFVFNFNLNFEGTTIVSPSTVLKRFFKKIVPSQFKFDDPKLEHEFTVQSDNLTFAHKVLTNDFMHRLLALQSWSKKKVHLSFVDGKLYLAIVVHKDLFEPTIFSSVVNFELIQEFFEYLQIGKEIVEYLSVNFKNTRQNLPLNVNPFDKNLMAKVPDEVPAKVTSSSRQESCTSWCRLSRFIVILVSILIMLISLGATFRLLNLSESIALLRVQTLEKGENTIILIDNYSIDNFNESQLVHLSGEATTNEILTDKLFDVTAANMIKLKRVVEMYQWEESAYGYVYYSYSPVWSEPVIDSKQFRESAEHHNPAMPVKGKTFIANTVKLGAFTLSSHFLEKMDIEKIDHYQWLPMQKDNFYQLPKDIHAELNKPIHLNDGNYYLGKNPAHPQIGDLRIRFEVMKPEILSVIAKQSGSLLTPYKTQKVSGKNELSGYEFSVEIGLYEYGDVPPSTMFRNAKISSFFDDVHFDGLHLRLISFIILFFGFYITLLMLRKLLNFSSSFEDSLDWVNWISLIIIAIIIAASLSIIIIAGFWITYSPILGILLLVIAGGILYLLKWVRHLFQNPPVEEPESMLVPETVVPSKY